MRIPLSWLSDHVELPEGATAESVAADLVSVGLEEEAILPAQVTGPLVVGRVLAMEPRLQTNGKTINWCRVDVGPEHNEEKDDAKDPQPGEEVPSRGIICGAHNFEPGDLVVVSLPGTVLPGGFEIAARKTYGHLSDGMICSTEELGLGPDPSEEHGIIVLGRGIAASLEAEPGDDAIALLGLGDEVVDVNITPDRGYCFSLRGVAREYSHATGAAFRDPGIAETDPATTGGFAIELDDDAPLRGQVGCDLYVARRVIGVDPQKPSPRWMQQYLTGAGMRPISLIVDVANYVMLDLGQPLHTFDARSLAAPIVVRRARAGETLVTLDDQTRELDPEDLVIADSPDGENGARVVALAGVMGGASTEVTGTTTDVLLEGAHFSQVSVARTARRHRLPSEAAKRFERGVDPRLPEVAVQRAAELIARYGGGSVGTDVTVEGSVAPPAEIAFPRDAARRLVGIDYAPEQVTGPLEKIGCLVTETEAGYTVTPPSWRPDLTEPADLVEEVARLNGYATIPSVLPAAPGGRGLTESQRARRSVARSLAELGLVELLTYPFTSTEAFDTLRYGADDERRHAVRLLNPLAETEPLLHTELLQTLLAAARTNIGRGADSVAVFETGLVFTPAPADGPAPVPPGGSRPTDAQLAEIAAAVPSQPHHVAGVLAGPSSEPGWWDKPRPYDWADAVEAAKRTAETLNVGVVVSQAERAPWHPGRCARLETTGGVLLGYAGELHPAVAKAYSLPDRAAAFELDLSGLIDAKPVAVEAEPISTYPAAKEDFAFVVDRSVPAAAVEAAMRDGLGELLESIHLFDVYEGPSIGSDRRSLAFTVRLRSQAGTLKGKQIAAARVACIQAVETATGAELRA